MSLAHLPALLGLWTLATVAPGWVLARRIGRPRTCSAGLALILGCSAFAVPAVVFAASILTLEPIGPAFGLGVAAVLALLALRSPTAPWTLPSPQPAEWAVAAAALGAGLFQVAFLDTALHWNGFCTYLPCTVAAGEIDVGFGPLNMNIGYPGHQRMGVTAVLAPATGMFGLAGVRLHWALVFAALPPSVWSLARALDLSAPSATAAAVFAAAAPAIVGVADPNRLLLALIAFAAVLAASRPAPAFLGAALALIQHAEPAVILAAPALLPWLSRPRLRSLRRGALGFGLASLPFVLRNAVAFGAPWTHEHFSYIPPQPYQLLGRALELPAFLNWPLHGQLVRSPYNPLPNLALVPLSILEHWGLLAASLALVGSGVLLRRQPRVAASLALGFVPLVAFLALNENWTQKDKWGIAVMAYLAPLLGFAAGLDWIGAGRRLLRIVAVGAVGWGLALVWQALAGLEVPEDDRYRRFWSERYQHLPPEDAGYLAWERSTWSRPPLLPRSARGFGAALAPRASLAALGEHLTDWSVRGRSPSALDLELMALGTAGDPNLEASLPHRGAPVACSDCVPIRIDLRRSPGSNLGRAAHFSAPCSLDGPEVDLGRDHDAAAVRVPWAPGPVDLVLVDPPLGGTAVLMLVRALPHEFEAQRGPLRGPPLRAGCVAVHLPAGRPLQVWDQLSFDPGRTYRFAVSGERSRPRLRLLGR